ncbi:sensor histidine kinase [Aliikangiella sp. IMCC44632]
MKIRISIEAQIVAICLAAILLCGILIAGLGLLLGNILGASLIGVSIVSLLMIVFIRGYTKSINKTLSAIHSGFFNFLDNEFSVSLAQTRNDELGDLIDIYNRVSTTLRQERMHVYQRELLLDTVIQSTPLALFLVDSSDKLIYSNSAGRHLFNHGKAINGLNFSQLVAKQPSPFGHAIHSQLDGLFTIEKGDASETYHITQNRFLLNSKENKLYLIKQLTKEINRQEVNTWKKVIRLISHELNNSLAPISSLAHSGQLLSQRENQPKIEKVFNTIEERARYLKDFIEGYATFARLPTPRTELIPLDSFLHNLTQIKLAEVINDSSEKHFYADPAQLQQVIINLLKNAHESGSPVEAIQLVAKVSCQVAEFQILDAGKGMTEKGLLNALMPFYSTKAGGTGLGLPLCREIVEAHGGKLIINNRIPQGLQVILLLPNTPSKTTSHN